MKRLAFFVLLLAILAGGVSLAAARTWKDQSGKFEVDADFVGYSNGIVQLRKPDSTVISVPMEELSGADQRFVRDELTRRQPVSAVVTATSGQWPQWRGPNRDGVSGEVGLLDSWPQGGPPLLWSVGGCGQGYSSVSIADGRIFTMGGRDGGEFLIALDLNDGHELWATRVGGGRDCNCTPTVDGDLVFALGREGDLLCANAKTGREVWRKNFGRDFGGKMMSGWGYSESPLVDGDRLICTPGSPRAIIAALDKRTGRVIWQTPMAPGGDRGKDGAGYASIVISRAAGVKQYVTLVGRGVIGVAAENGRPLWQYSRIANDTANIPTPAVRDDYVFCSSGYGEGGTALLKLSRGSRGIEVDEIYYLRSNQLQNHHGGMVLIGDHVYLGHGHNNGFPVCVELHTGKDAWRPGRGPGSGSAAVVAADGNLYFRYQDGTMALIEASPTEYKLKGTFRIKTHHGESWPHPVIAGGKLYLRDQRDLHVYDIAKK
jgi:outer membrane protein assembly factor BamB